jgi:DNA-binding transcriptional LysR family regulator
MPPAAGTSAARLAIIESAVVRKSGYAANPVEGNFTMRREYLAGLTAFAAVAEKRSFTAAAAQLGISSSAVSHAVRDLEARLGLRLLNRSTRSVNLTEAGERYIARVMPALRELAQAADGLDELRDTAAGLLRINVSRPAYHAVLAGRLNDFHRLHPHVQLEVIVDDTLTDIVATGCDAGIRLGETLQQDMVAIPVSAPLELVVCGSRDYFKRHPMPTSPTDLRDHACIAFRFPSSGKLYRWELARDGQELSFEPSGWVVANEASVLLDLARSGAGLACVLWHMVAEDLARGDMIRVLADWCQPFPGYFLYHPSHRHVPAKLRALIEFLRR